MVRTRVSPTLLLANLAQLFSHDLTHGPHRHRLYGTFSLYESGVLHFSGPFDSLPGGRAVLAQLVSVVSVGGGFGVHEFVEGTVGSNQLRLMLQSPLPQESDDFPNPFLDVVCVGIFRPGTVLNISLGYKRVANSRCHRNLPSL